MAREILGTKSHQIFEFSGENKIRIFRPEEPQKSGKRKKFVYIPNKNGGYDEKIFKKNF